MSILAYQQRQWERCLSLYRQNKLPQALLFSGEKGLGKVQFAHDFVRWALCHAPTDRPCDACQSCRWMLAKAHPECFIVAPLENTKNNATITVDQIRELIAVIQLSAQHAQKKWILIEQADKLNVAASNALLKILEEPTDTTMFILISSHKQVLKQTIISRVTEVSFSKPISAFMNEQPSETQARLQFIAELCSLSHSVSDSVSNNSKLSARSVDPSLVAERWAKIDHNNTLYLFYTWLSDLVYLKMDKNAGSSKVINQDHLDILKQVVAPICPIALFSLLGKVEQALASKAQISGINDQLCFEDILVNYLHII